MSNQTDFDEPIEPIAIPLEEIFNPLITRGNSNTEYPLPPETWMTKEQEEVFRNNAAKLELAKSALIDIVLRGHEFKDNYHEICEIHCPACIAVKVLKQLEE